MDLPEPKLPTIRISQANGSTSSDSGTAQGPASETNFHTIRIDSPTRSPPPSVPYPENRTDRRSSRNPFLPSPVVPLGGLSGGFAPQASPAPVSSLAPWVPLRQESPGFITNQGLLDDPRIVPLRETVPQTMGPYGPTPRTPTEEFAEYPGDIHLQPLTLSPHRPHRRLLDSGSFSQPPSPQKPSVAATPTAKLAEAFQNFSARVSGRDSLFEANDDSDTELHDQRSTAPSAALTDGAPSEPTLDLLPHQSRRSSAVPPRTGHTPPSRVPLSQLRLFGNSLRYFTPQSRLRLWCSSVLVNPKVKDVPVVMLLGMTALLAYQQWNPLALHSYYWDGSNYMDAVILAFNLFFLLETTLRVITFGLWDDSQMFAELHFLRSKNKYREYAETVLEGLVPGYSRFSRGRHRANREGLFPQSNPFAEESKETACGEENRAILRPVSAQLSSLALRSGDLRKLMLERAYLRSSWNVLDVFSSVCFFVSLLLGINRYDVRHNVMVFRSLACVRIFRLTAFTRGTHSILRSIRKAAPQLANVGLFVLCFWIFFLLLGVQSFKASFDRVCTWQNPTDVTDTFINTDSLQFCGSWLSDTRQAMLFVYQDGTPSGRIKGFRCPVNSKCISYSDTHEWSYLSFDNIVASMKLVAVIMSANTFSDIMYYTMDSDSMATSLFFIAAIFILTVWLLNVFAAVIVKSFILTIEEKNKRKRLQKNESFDLDQFMYQLNLSRSGKPWAVRVYRFCERMSLLVILSGFVVQCLRTSSITTRKAAPLIVYEGVVTAILLLEIGLRFVAHFPSWRNFFNAKQNALDLALALVTGLIAIPPLRVRMGVVYGWFTLFQILRLYRLVLAIPYTRKWWVTILGNFRIVIDLGLFYMMLTFLFSIIVARFFEGFVLVKENHDILQEEMFSMYSLPNTFLALCVITTSENWTQILYRLDKQSKNTSSRIIGDILLIGWFFASFVVIFNIFVAIIAQNFDVSEHQKRQHQLHKFVDESARELEELAIKNKVGNLNRIKTSFFKRTPRALDRGFMQLLFNAKLVDLFLERGGFGDVDEDVYGLRGEGLSSVDEPSLSGNPFINNAELPSCQDPLGKGVPLQSMEPHETDKAEAGVESTVEPESGTGHEGRQAPRPGSRPAPLRKDSVFSLTAVKGSWTLLSQSWKTASLTVVAGLHRLRHYHQPPVPATTHLSLTPASLPRQIIIHQAKVAASRRRILMNKPNYNRSLTMFQPGHPLRWFCQKVVPPSFGERMRGVQPATLTRDAVTVILFLANIGMVFLACYTTPLYRKEHDLDTGKWDWTAVMDLVFLMVFQLEFMVKAIADGVYFTPNGYLRLPWNLIDTVVLLTMWINMIAFFLRNDELSRAVRGFKALRALRLLTISKRAQAYFNNTMIAGFRNIVGAAVICVCLIIPYAVWGVNIFSERLGLCLDENSTRAECINEFSKTVGKWAVLSPKAYTEPRLNMNSFLRAFMTLYEILSLEGWLELLESVSFTTGIGTVPLPFASPFNAVFVVGYIFMGMVIILTTFVSVITSKYAKVTGVAYFTTAQITWYDISKFLKNVKPSHRPDQFQMGRFRRWCVNLTLEHHPVAELLLNLVLLVHFIMLMMEKYPSSFEFDLARQVLYTITTSVLLAHHFIMVYALGLRKFLQRKWNVSLMLILLGAFCMSITNFHVQSNFATYLNINKLFLMGILLFAIPRSNRLSQLLKFASASLPSLLAVVYTWLVAFLVFAIAMNQIFGLTRIGPTGLGNINFRTVTKSIIVLFRMSFGEGWNDIMRDYAVQSPNCYTAPGLNNSDCGSDAYAYFLFCLWNVISMYVFLNMFVSIVLDNFSYVYSSEANSALLLRVEVRRFKKAWQRLDSKGTGFIARDDLHLFLNSLEGMFRFKVYEGAYLVPKLTTAWFWVGSSPYDVHLRQAEMQTALDRIDVEKVRLRRRLYERFLQEIYVVSDEKHGGRVNFTDVLVRLTLYTHFNEGECLSLPDFLERTRVMAVVEERLRAQKLAETMVTVICRWKYLRRYPSRDLFQSAQSVPVMERRLSQLRPYHHQSPSGNVLDTPQLVLNEYGHSEPVTVLDHAPPLPGLSLAPATQPASPVEDSNPFKHFLEPEMRMPFKNPVDANHGAFESFKEGEDNPFVSEEERVLTLLTDIDLAIENSPWNPQEGRLTD